MSQKKDLEIIKKHIVFVDKKEKNLLLSSDIKKCWCVKNAYNLKKKGWNIIIIFFEFNDEWDLIREWEEPL